MFVSFFVLFHSCCSHAQVFGKTLVHEFLISYSHTEWHLFFSDSATTSAQKRILCEMATVANALVTLYQLNYVSRSRSRRRRTRVRNAKELHLDSGKQDKGVTNCSRHCLLSNWEPSSDALSWVTFSQIKAILCHWATEYTNRCLPIRCSGTALPIRCSGIAV